MREPMWFGRLDPGAGGDVRAVARLLHHAFAGPIDKSEEWIRMGGLENIRLVRDHGPSGSIVASLMRVPMGQYFGGRSVPMLGIAGVATAPEARGRGLAREMMREALLEARAVGTPISCLYASTAALYRQVGYEHGGSRFQVTLPIHRIAVEKGQGAIRPLTDGDEEAVREIYRRFAATFDGMLDRGPYLWARTKKFREVDYEGFGWLGTGGELEGYIRLTQTRKPETGGHDVSIQDLAYTSGAAGRGLLRFIADFATMGEDAVFSSGAIHPLLTMIGARHYRVEKRDYWFVRVLDVAGAIAARGYAPGMRAEFEMEIADDLIEENAGRWRVRVADGRGSAEKVKGGGGLALRADIRGLASMYCGLYTARQARLAGLVEGEEEAVGAAEGVFGAGGGSWMVDMF